ITDRIIAQASLIWAGVIVRGGAIRIALSQKRNQSVTTPFEIARSMMGFRTSNDSNSTAIISPKFRISLIFGLTNKDRKRLALLSTTSNNFSFRITSSVAKEAAALTG